MITAPFRKIEATVQQADIAVSKGPTEIYDGWGRIKQYVKDDEMGHGRHPRVCAFDQPYQIASHYGFGTWEECNLVFTAQFAECNLNCPYCFVSDDKAEIVNLSPRDIVEGFTSAQEERRNANIAVPHVLRLSGGEPTLCQDWLVEFFYEWAASSAQRTGYLWMDTNLSIQPNNVLKQWLGALAAQGKASICGCFKPGQVSIDEEADIARQYAEAGVSLFLYWPCDEYRPSEFVQALEMLYEISPGLPLRLQPIKIKWQYEAVKARGVIPPDEDAGDVWCQTWDDWLCWCQAHYRAAELWQPSHLANIKLGEDKLPELTKGD